MASPRNLSVFVCWLVGLTVLAGSTSLSWAESRGTSERGPTLKDEGQQHSDGVNFCVVADWQIADDNLTLLAERLVAEQPDFILIPGDLIMANGADPAPWDAFFERIQPLLDAGIPLRPVPGNHDFDGDIAGARQQWIDRWDLPGAELFYSFDAGPAHVTAVCVSKGHLHHEVDLPDGRTTQLEWFRRDLEASKDAPWRFVFHHEPGTAFCRLSAGIDGPGIAEVTELVETPAWRDGVDLIFRGHQHLYQRTYPLNPVSRVRDDRRGTALITVGGGCIAYRPQLPEDGIPRWSDAIISLHQMHYLRIAIKGDHLEAEAKNLGGEVFDRFVIRKSADGSREWEGLPPVPVFLVKNKPHAY